MTKRLTEATAADYEELEAEVGAIMASSCTVSAGRFVAGLYERFSDSLVLLRLFITLRYDQLPAEDRLFVARRGEETKTSLLLHAATPIFTLLGTRGQRPEWNERSASSHFRCIPLVSTAFVSSLSMLSRQFESVGFDLGLIDAWEREVVVTGSAERYRGILYIHDAGVDRDAQGRMIVPKQDFVAAAGVKTTLGFGSGYADHPTMVTLFAFTNEGIERSAVEPISKLLEGFIASTAALVREGRFF